MSKLDAFLQSGHATGSAALSWWWREIEALLPVRAKAFLAGTGKSVVLQIVEGGYRIRAEGQHADAGVGGGDVITARAQAIAAAVGFAQRDGNLAITLQLPQSACFVRTVEVPRSALKDCRRLLDLDLERATPFRRADVYTSYKVLAEHRTDAKVSVRQFVTKREIVDPVVAEIVQAGGRIAGIDCARDAAGMAAGINFIEEADGDGRGRFVTPATGLAIAACLLLLLAAGQALYKREVALGELRDETAQMRRQAASVRQALEQSQVAINDLALVQKIKTKQVPLLVVLEEITRILPDTAWITELRVENDIVDISGLAKSGANLLPLFERSPIFADAALTAPLTFDQREDKERFSLRVRLRSSEARGAGAAG